MRTRTINTPEPHGTPHPGMPDIDITVEGAKKTPQKAKSNENVRP
jgi:hypothetical protein